MIGAEFMVQHHLENSSHADSSREISTRNFYFSIYYHNESCDTIQNYLTNKELLSVHSCVTFLCRCLLIVGQLVSFIILIFFEPSYQQGKSIEQQ